MKKYIFLTLFFSFSVFQVQGLAQQPLFDQANSLLERGEYQQAIELYRSIADNGYDSGALWLNMGVAYTRIDSLGKAKYYFLKAGKYNETKYRAGQALSVVNNRFPRQSAVLPPLPWIRFINFLSDSVGLRTMVFSALFFLYVGVALKIGSWFRVDMKKAFRSSGYTALVISGILFLSSAVIHYQDSRYSTGVMVDREGPIYQQPNDNASVISTAYEGYTMRVDQKESADKTGWKYVRLENGMYGWIHNDHIMIF